jgi:hypothetical protein
MDWCCGSNWLSVSAGVSGAVESQNQATVDRHFGEAALPEVGEGEKGGRAPSLRYTLAFA